jgi:hypothetical protein
MFVFWFITACGLIGTYRRFGETLCLRLQGLSIWPWKWRQYVSAYLYSACIYIQTHALLKPSYRHVSLRMLFTGLARKRYAGGSAECRTLLTPQTALNFCFSFAVTGSVGEGRTRFRFRLIYILKLTPSGHRHSLGILSELNWCYC